MRERLLFAVSAALIAGACVAGCGGGDGGSGQSGTDEAGVVDGSAGDATVPNDGASDSTVPNDGSISSDSSTNDGASNDGASNDGATDGGGADADAGCTAPLVLCGNTCVDTTKDNNNCGACSNACTGGLVCSNSVCNPSCTPPAILCPAPDGGAPDAGDAGADGGADGGTGAYCANTGNDPNNCGACGKACAAGMTCTNSQCVCAKDKADCNNDPKDGCETSLGTTTDCASCSDKCNPQNAQGQCTNGACSIATCNPGFSNCDNNAANGCETNTNNDSNNCNTCGNVCPFGPHSTAKCTTGACSIVCDPGWANCDNNPTNGCETHVDVDTNNCGACNNICNEPNATATCVGGKCQIAQCNTGYGDCDNNAANGCETHTAVDPNNCGNCLNKCVEPNATPACVNGSCAVGQCNAGFKDCDGMAADGCEVNVLNDPNNCGGCNIKCVIANGTAACVNGQCAVGTCNPGYTDCNGQVADGCETGTGFDPNNCGTCNHVCNIPNGAASCTSGVCTVANCNAGYSDCNNQPGDGCEVHVANDVNNCGTCGHQCSVLHGTAGCGNGTCNIFSCTAPWGDCQSGYADGCETDTSSSNANCGQCGKNCSTTCVGNVAATACVASACTITACSAGFTDNDKSCADGCECTNSTTATTCAGANNLGVLSPGATMTPFKSTLMPVMVAGVPNSAWFAITFTGNGSTAYHPKITLTDPSGEFVMDVQTDCSGTLISTCTAPGEQGNTHGVTAFETYYLGAGPPPAPNPPGDPNSKNSGGASNFQPISVTGTLYVHVYRRNPNVATTCNQYTLNASD